LGFGEGGCHRFADSLHEHLNGRSTNSLNLRPSAIRSVIPIKPIATQSRNNLRRIECDSTMLGEKIKDESLRKRKGELEEVTTAGQ
jgi:hypothetical protein